MSVSKMKAMTLTDAAAERVKALLIKAGPDVVGLRVGVKNSGCGGMAYTMDFATSVEPFDEVVEDKGVKIIIDGKAVLFLLGSEMDFETDKMSAQFTFNNPNQTSACGCGESVAITPLRQGESSLSERG